VAQKWCSDMESQTVVVFLTDQQVGIPGGAFCCFFVSGSWPAASGLAVLASVLVLGSVLVI
jgi:hypothetical protein